MEWKTKPKLESGQTRERLKFAWWPVECEDGVTRWLCEVRVVERYDFDYDDGFRWTVLKCYRAEIEE